LTDFAPLSLSEFLAVLASAAPTPGGGTAAAVAGSMGAALAEMVAQITLSKDKFASVHEAIRPIADAAQTARAEFLKLAREDSDAYDAVVAARKLPKDSEAEKTARQHQIAVANRQAAEVPMRTAQAAVRLLAALPELAEKGNPNAVSDVGAAALLLDACVEGALLNVGINLSGIDEPAFVAEMQRETAVAQGESQRLRSQVVALVRRRF
jgi:formiminotetrahydrofolate cyclodeaminase